MKFKLRLHQAHKLLRLQISIYCYAFDSNIQLIIIQHLHINIFDSFLNIEA